jgi:cell division protein FtsB
MRRLLPVLILVFAAASITIFFFGDLGVLACRTLERHRGNLSANVDALKMRNAALRAELAALKDDPSRIAVLARGIGLFHADDRVVVLEGLPQQMPDQALGDLLRQGKKRTDRNAIIKTVAIAVSALFLAYALLSLRRSGRKAHGSQGR